MYFINTTLPSNQMTDVTEGGATVFPLLNITVKPEKGSALIWYNLYRDGQGNYLTLV